MKRAVVSLLTFAATAYALLAAWNAFDIFVLGNVEPKWGGPWDTFRFGLGFSLVVVAFLTVGWLSGWLLSNRFFTPLGLGGEVKVSALGALAVVALAATEVLSGVTRFLPGDFVPIVVVVLSAGVVGRILVHWLSPVSWRRASS